ncbi:tRNA dihydrouridine(20/20a) synthase DusA [Ahrensia kielensis]|uniref:tRNA dihydrouridine(20/20a) synthase DusA n=1 Tax=Ahrensia kielensis TaxID=76980 RepID=UPI0003A1E7E6|nr:tRNA dihydrouridine(20/20a) synthase DusA [Ahrensia kielensis]
MRVNETVRDRVQDTVISNVYDAKKHLVFSIAPMMDWTDRHCRFFHRQLTKHALLYTEMVVADAVIHGNRERLLGFDAVEHPVAVQIGGSEPQKMAEAARICADYGYAEVNMNVGCPSDRVQSGTFGACLMREPDLVARCVDAMKEAVDIPVTVKCRIGVDDQDTQKALDDVAQKSWDAGCDGLWVHARKAWLQGLSPKENRDVPPLDYARVLQLKAKNPSRFIGLNGGLENVIHGLDAAKGEGITLDGIMLGRAAYQNPLCLSHVDPLVYGEENASFDAGELIDAMCDYIDAQIASDSGIRVNHITRHMVGLFPGVAGARRFRQILSNESVKPNASSQVLRDAFDIVRDGLGKDSDNALDPSQAA